ncbi:MAG: hypothetical protein AAF413_01065 [Patescibacteria group bacterium]
MDTLITFMIAGTIPGTDISINYEAFLQGVLIGLTAILIHRFISKVLRVRKNRKFIQSRSI